jgi:hydrogenase nickel incorporation protein HypA/HybF
MHELSIAMSIIDVALEEAAQRNVKVTAVHIKVGALSGVVPDALLASYEMACCDTPLAGSKLVIEEVPVLIKCPQCRQNKPPSAAQWFCCADCGAPAAEIVQGKELQIVALEVPE